MWKREKETSGKEAAQPVEAGSSELVRVPTGPTVDAVWGEIAEDGPDYRALGWIRATVIECKLQFGLGVLAIPSVLHTLGFVPGILCIVVVAIMTAWSNYVLGMFKINHPEVYTIADVGYIFFGEPGREALGLLFWILMVALCGSTLLSVSIAFNAFTAHATCTVVFVAVAAIITAIFASIQTMHKISWVGWGGLAFLMTAIIAVTVAVGVQERPSAAPQTGPWDPEVRAFANPTLIEAMNAVSLVIFAYGGTPTFFGVISEMKRPQDFNKSALWCQGIITVFYLIIGSVIYYYAGQYVSSPALGTGGPVMKKVCYAIALAGLFAGGILLTHVAAKYVFVRLLKGTRDLSENTVKHYVFWYASVALTSIIAFVIAEAIPFFSNLVGLIGALLVSFFTLQLMAVMWIYDNWKGFTTLRKKLLLAFNIFVFFAGVFVMITGTWGAAVAINDQLKAGDTTSPFSCRDNSGS